MAKRRLIVTESDGAGPARRSTWVMEVGSKVEVGRESSIGLGVEPDDLLVSRSALVIEYTEAGWVIECCNRNGVVMHPWGLPAWRAQDWERSSDSRLALRVIGSPGREHWVLLEDDTGPGGTGGGRRSITDGTPHARAIQQLTPAQLQAVQLMFPDVLSWPPVLAAPPRQIKQVARSLRIGGTAVRKRLLPVVARAHALGLRREVTTTDPEYVYVLVRAGYLRPDQFPSAAAP